MTKPNQLATDTITTIIATVIGMLIFGELAQLVERVVRNDEVRGSIPLLSTLLRRVGWNSAEKTFPRIGLPGKMTGSNFHG